MATVTDPVAPDYRSFFAGATGHPPYPWQERVAAGLLPEVVSVPTGAGKTAGIALAWLWRRTNEATRDATPRRLVWALPMRVLANQTHDAIAGWVERLGLGDAVDVHLLLGGEGRRTAGWLDDPTRDAVIVGTVDMLLSRALNRGYAASPFVWPVDFGLFNNDCHWVFDEVQLLGPAVPTSRQLQAFRAQFGTVGPTGTTWMSATVDSAALDTVDNPVADALVVGLDAADQASGLAVRLGGTKTVRELADLAERNRAREIAERLVAAHRPGTLTLAVCNTVAAARDLWEAVRRHVDGPDVLLVHSRFRPPERTELERRLRQPVDPAGPGLIAVCTQVVEAGVDVSAATLFTEAAPWPSVVQRAGRCNRDGTIADAVLLWAEPPKPDPYPEADVKAAAEALRSLEGTAVTPKSLGARAVEVTRELHPALRRRDLVDLFDTSPDLTGNFLDVSRFIRVTDDVDAYVCWRRPAEDEALRADELSTQPAPTRDELCPVPAGELRRWAAQSRGVRLWWHDHVAAAWVVVEPGAVRPGRIYVVDAGAGGYDPMVGWDPKRTAPVDPVAPEEELPLGLADADVGADPASFRRRRWVRLERHLADVVREADRLLGPLAVALGDGLASAVREAARLHDIGKAHEVFQDTMLRAAPEDRRPRAAEAGPWAKSAGSARHARRAFRHELVSALALLAAIEAGAPVLPDGVDPNLVAYLVSAHHGRVRLGVRALPNEIEEAGTGRQMLGVREGDEVPEVAVPGGTVPGFTVRLAVTELGRAGGVPSWTERALALRDDPALGPFRLAFAEALVRLADWRASAAEEEGPDDLMEAQP